MMKRVILFAFLTLLCFSAKAINSEDMYPFGWCTCADGGGSFRISGGSYVEGVCKDRRIILKSDGKDMRDRIVDAVKNYDTIVLDGVGGDFLVSSYMPFEDLTNKTIVGIRGARLVTMFHLTPDIFEMLDPKNVRQYSSMGGGGLLSNGISVAEEREQHIRQFMIDFMNDGSESYRNAGIFCFFGNSSNLIIRNIEFQGPGAIDVGGADLVTIGGASNHIWIDHCVFNDGMDGNLDINGSATDYITVSWCVFKYGDYSYIHNLSGLALSRNGGHFTFAYNVWGEGCEGRMPAAGCAALHLLNNYYGCTGNVEEAVKAPAGTAVLLEGCYFDKGVKKIFQRVKKAAAHDFRDNICVERYRFKSMGTVDVPYKYVKYPVETLPEMILGPHGAGCHL